MSKTGQRLIAAAREQIAKTRSSWVFPEYTELAPAVRRFFEILDATEYSERADKDFHPIRVDVDEKAKAYISSIRVYKTAELGSLLPQMKRLANGKQVQQSKTVSD